MVVYILRKHFDGKGIQVFFAISLNVHADVGVGMQEGDRSLLVVYSQLEFALLSEIAVPLGDNVCMCGKCLMSVAQSQVVDLKQ
jgi:hypothetical protein